MANFPSLKTWTNGIEVRVYINAAYSDYRMGMVEADGAFFYANEDGTVHLTYKSSASGIYGEAALRACEWFGIDRSMPFSELVRCVDNAKGPRGGAFNIDAFHRLLGVMA